MPDSEQREDYAATHEHAEKVTESVKPDHRDGEKDVTPQLRKRGEHDED